MAKIGRVLFTGNGNVLKYGIGSCSTPTTVAFWIWITVLSRDATDIAEIPLPGDEVKNAPTDPSLPAAMVTILPESEIRLDTTDAEDSVHPSLPPSDIVRMSCPSETPRRRASIITVLSSSSVIHTEGTMLRSATYHHQ